MKLRVQNTDAILLLETVESTNTTVEATLSWEKTVMVEERFMGAWESSCKSRFLTSICTLAAHFSHDSDKNKQPECDFVRFNNDLLIFITDCESLHVRKLTLDKYINCPELRIPMNWQTFPVNFVFVDTFLICLSWWGLPYGFRLTSILRVSLVCEEATTIFVF